MNMDYFEASAFKGFGLENIFFGSTRRLVEQHLENQKNLKLFETFRNQGKEI